MTETSTAGSSSRCVEELDQELTFQLGLKSRKLFDVSCLPDPNRRRLVGEVAEYLRTVVTSAPQTNVIKVHGGIVDDPWINGQAFSVQRQGCETRFVTITAGSILYFYEFFAYLLSRPDVLPQIGNAAAETNPATKFTPSQSFPIFHSVPGTLGPGHIKPNCPLRESFAAATAGLALRFLIEHELAHALCGHVAIPDFLGSEREVDIITKLFGALPRQSLEMCADKLSVARLVNSEVSEFKKGKRYRFAHYLTTSVELPMLYPLFFAWNSIPNSS